MASGWVSPGAGLNYYGVNAIAAFDSGSGPKAFVGGSIYRQDLSVLPDTPTESP